MNQFPSLSGFDIRTWVENDLIISEVQVSHREAIERIEYRVVDTLDEMVRQALIDLGWAPPAEKSP